jgi:hypothetical protein
MLELKTRFLLNFGSFVVKVVDKNGVQEQKMNWDDIRTEGRD